MLEYCLKVSLGGIMEGFKDDYSFIQAFMNIYVN
jgi:hypothetical protein